MRGTLIAAKNIHSRAPAAARNPAAPPQQWSQAAGARAAAAIAFASAAAQSALFSVNPTLDTAASSAASAAAAAAGAAGAASATGPAWGSFLRNPPILPFQTLSASAPGPLGGPLAFGAAFTGASGMAFLLLLLPLHHSLGGLSPSFPIPPPFSNPPFPNSPFPRGSSFPSPPFP
ncbi:unnamed protein product [Closterium sp. NIES-64]|nr:unnamed protein product [Closterium sp. NIES-64]CAI6004128.1 unnamed protein product [Closterium sp. NIES-64]